MDCGNGLQQFADTQKRIAELQQTTSLLARRVEALEEVNKHNRCELDTRTQANRGLGFGPPVAGLSPGKGDTAKLIDMERFIRNILDPDMYGYAVSREVRNAARRVLGMEAKE